MSKKCCFMSAKKPLINDLILIVAIFVVAVLALLVFKATQKEGSRAVVTVDGEIVAEYSIDKNINETIKTKYGKNILEIKDKIVYISMADCPDKICQKHRPISKIGESIVCLPHKLVVKIENGDNTNPLDALV